MTLVGGSGGSADEKGSSDEAESKGGGGKNEQGEQKFGRSSWEDDIDMSWRNVASVLDCSDKLHLQSYLEMIWSKTGYFGLLGNNIILVIILLDIIKI